MKIAVIGLGFGDEGKGLVTEYLCSNSNPLVVRYSGGQQAGHTVVKDDIRHIFSNFGSGTLSGAATYWSKFCTIDPIGLTNELHLLRKEGVINKPLLFIDRKCPITTPYDVRLNQNLNRDIKNGTCGVGVGTTIEREENLYSLVAEDIMHPTAFNIKLNLIKNHYYHYKTTAITRFLECIEEIRKDPSIQIVDRQPSSINVVYEGSQGLLLDPEIGFFPHVTHSNTGTKNIINNINIGSFELYLVTRAYQTRHGKGPMTNEEIPHNILVDPNETNLDHPYQGVFRRSILDIDLLLYGMIKDKNIKHVKKKTLVITCLDHINEYKYTFGGSLYACLNESDFVDQIRTLLGFHSVLISNSPYSSKIKRFI